MVLFSKIANGNAVAKPSSAISIFEGTMIQVPGGERPIEEIKAGDLVMTFRGPKPVAMVLKQEIPSFLYASDRRSWAVRIRTGALGFDLPKRDLYVLGSQRIMFRHLRIPLVFKCEAVMMEARSLCAVLEDVKIENRKGPVTYHQIAFAEEEILFANGAPIGSFKPTSIDLAAATGQVQADMRAIYPQLEKGGKVKDCGLMTMRSWELMSALR